MSRWSCLWFGVLIRIVLTPELTPGKFGTPVATHRAKAQAPQTQTPHARHTFLGGHPPILVGVETVSHRRGVEVRIYSGASGGLRSRTGNHVPVTIAEITMDPHVSLEQEIPTLYSGFPFVISGSVTIGEKAALLKTGQVGWLDRPGGEGSSVLHVAADEEGARLVLYAGQPQGNPIVSYGPFVGDSKEDIVRLLTEYRAGQFVRMSELVRRAG